MAMTIIGFIPGIDVISDAYFLGRALIDVAQRKGSWTGALPIVNGEYRKTSLVAKCFL